MGGSGGGREALRVARCRSPSSAASRHLLPTSGEKDARYREPLAPRKRGEGGRRPGEGVAGCQRELPGNRQLATGNYCPGFTNAFGSMAGLISMADTFA